MSLSFIFDYLQDDMVQIPAKESMYTEVHVISVHL
jgi:hypothetical protein